MKDHAALTKCFYCMGDNEILLCTHYNDGVPVQDMRVYHGKVCSMTPCPKCTELMKQGVILITIDPDKSKKDWNIPPSHIRDSQHLPPEQRPFWAPNPYRTGGWFVVTDDAIKRAISSEHMRNWALERRWLFIDHAVGEQLGLFDLKPTQTGDTE